MHASHQTLSLLAADLAVRLPGASVASAYSQDADELYLAFTGRSECLFVSCSATLPILFLHDSCVRAKRNSADVLKQAVDTLVTGVRIHDSDRILTLTLSGDFLLEVHLFGNRSNVLLLDAHRVVVDAFRNGRHLAGTRIDPPTSVVYPPLTSQVIRLSGPAASVSPFVSQPAPMKIDREPTQQSVPAVTVNHAAPIQLAMAMTVQAALKRSAPLIPPLVLRELLYRAGLSLGVLVREMTQESWSALTEAAARIERDLLVPHPRLISTSDGLPLHFSLLPLTHLPGTREEVYTDVHEALRGFFVRTRSSETFHREHLQLRDALRRRIEKVERVCAAIRTDQGTSDRAARYRQYGSLLMEHLEEVPRHASTWTWTGSGTAEEIPLSPVLTPVQNAQRYFEKAKAAERSRRMMEERLRVYAGALTHTQDLFSELDTVSSRSALRTFMKQHNDELRSLGAVESEQDRERAPFRVFTVHGGFEVWAGKSSANNDDLTLHHAHPEDLWFHARGSSGSHVILKISSAAGEPGKRAREEAAGIAAYYSKMRNARIVPVAMTRRKYVHKPKGAPPGTVVIAREDVVMATPALPKKPAHMPKEENGDA
jgi:predicted ribosome quality control (RQC) complex YloA/Tae2 family protein